MRLRMACRRYASSLPWRSNSRPLIF
jgi:hypothetical protein